MHKRIVLHFPKEFVDKPVVYKLVKEFNLEFNILKAEINPEEEGILVLEIQGDPLDYKKGIDFLKESGLKIQPLGQDVVMNRSKCVDCTFCISLCPTQALRRVQETGEVEFEQAKCIACGVCIKACPYGAMSMHL